MSDSDSDDSHDLSSEGNGRFNSSGLSTMFAEGMRVLLFYKQIGVVGEGTVVDVSPIGHWLGINIVDTAQHYIMVRPSKFHALANHLPLRPPQDGMIVLLDTIGRAILWNIEDISVLSEDPSTSTCDAEQSNASHDSSFIRQDDWVGLPVERYTIGGELMSSGRINCSLPGEPFQNGVLGDGYVGVTVFDVFIGDPHDVMSHQKWPISECKFAGGRSLTDVLDHFAAFPDPVDPDAHLGGRKKAPYRYIHRSQRTIQRISKYTMKTTMPSVRLVSSLSCCPEECVRKFNQEDTLAVRQRYYLKSFDERREYGVAVAGQMHFVGNIRKRKYVTLLGTEVCATAWWKIHGIPKSTYHSYAEKYKSGVLSFTHGNAGMKRPRIGTMQAMGTISAIIDENVDHMPHQMRRTVPGRMDTLKFLPSGLNWKRVQADVTETNLEYGLPPVSQSTVSRIKKHLFNNVAIKPVGSSFAKCTLCDSLQQFVSKSVKGSPEYVSFVKQRTTHLNHQAACRRVYHSWREESKRNKGQRICIIHDKIDTNKTAIPRMRVTTKLTSALGQLPLNVTRMVTHGHGDGAYAHYSTNLWPGDSNYTISSLARLFRRLEEQPIRVTGELFPYPPPNSLCEALLRGKSRCIDILPRVQPDRPNGRVPLPEYLYLQLDNSAKDNKNQFLMGFMSMLTHRRVFKEIQVGFLLVGHTHEDIDAYFSHLSKTLKNRNTFVVADLMKSFMESQEMSFMPEFIQEVADFKSFIKGYLSDGAAKLIGIGDIHLFKFYVDDEGWPVMRFKESATDTAWLPRNKPPLRLWKADEYGNPKVPSGIPKPVPYKRVWGDETPSTKGNQEKAKEKASKAQEKKALIKSGIRGYIEFWERGMAKCEGFRRDFPPYVEYWQTVLAELEKPLPPPPSRLLEGFWPSTDWRHMPSTSNLQITATDVTPEDDEPEVYCGPANERPKEPLNPWRDIDKGWWIILCSPEPDIYPIWLGRALTLVCREEGHENFGKFLLQYWEPKNAILDHKKKYEDCWSKTWARENREPEMVSVGSILFASFSKKEDPKTRRISTNDRAMAEINLNRAILEDP